MLAIIATVALVVVALVVAVDIAMWRRPSIKTNEERLADAMAGRKS